MQTATKKKALAKVLEFRGLHFAMSGSGLDGGATTCCYCAGGGGMSFGLADLISAGGDAASKIITAENQPLVSSQNAAMQSRSMTTFLLLGGLGLAAFLLLR